jgi:hypothetical protein
MTSEDLDVTLMGLYCSYSFKFFSIVWYCLYSINSYFAAKRNPSDDLYTRISLACDK